MVSKIWSKPVTQKVIKSLRMQGVTVEKINGGYVGKIGTHEVFKAMQGTMGYLVRYEPDLFVTN